MDTEGEAWGIQIYIYTHNNVYNRFKLCVNDARSSGLCNSRVAEKDHQATEVPISTRIRMDHDKEDKLLLAMSQVYEIERAVRHEGMRQRYV